MAAPLAGIAIRYVAQRAAGFAVKTVAKQYGKRTSRQRMVQAGRKVGGVPMGPALQGPYAVPLPTQSTRGEHSIVTSGTPKARKTMRGGSAQRGTRRSNRTFRRDEERYRGRRY